MACDGSSQTTIHRPESDPTRLRPCPPNSRSVAGEVPADLDFDAGIAQFYAGPFDEFSQGQGFDQGPKRFHGRALAPLEVDSATP